MGVALGWWRKKMREREKRGGLATVRPGETVESAEGKMRMIEGEDGKGRGGALGEKETEMEGEAKERSQIRLESREDNWERKDLYKLWEKLKLH